MKINKKYESSIYDNVVLSTEEQQSLLSISEDNWKQYEAICHQITQTTASTIVPTKDFNAALQYLDAKITASRKTLSSYDVFKIVDSVDNENEIETKYSTLSENSGLIINVNVNFSNISFSQGDVLFKDYYGKIHKIANSVRGFYYPDSITYNSTDQCYTLKYAFKTGTPDNDEMIGIEFPSEVEKPSTTIYNISQALTSNSSLSIDKISAIHPIWDIRLYIDSTIGEKVFNAVKISEYSTGYTITNLTSQTLWIMAK